MELVQIRTIKELDELIPEIKALHEKLNDNYFSLTGFLSWVSINLHLDTFRVYKAIDNDMLMGYSVVQVTHRYFEPELEIVDAYMTVNDEEFSDYVHKELESWAKSKNCRYISCISPRYEALGKKYGFEPCGMIMRKQI